MMNCSENEAYENLANAIVAEAALEYMQARKSLDRRKWKYWEERKADCLRFFYSDWFRALTDMEPDALVGTLDREYKNGEWIDGQWMFGSEANPGATLQAPIMEVNL